MEGEADLDRVTFISGGQTGIDRALLDFCLQRGIPCGGWCPEGRMAEDGRIPRKYPVRELPGASYDQRTARNVEESRATVIIHPGSMKGGTLKSFDMARLRQKPLLILDMASLDAEEAADRLSHFLGQHLSGPINFSGPRASEWAEGYRVTTTILTLAWESRNFIPGD